MNMSSTPALARNSRVYSIRGMLARGSRHLFLLDQQTGFTGWRTHPWTFQGKRLESGFERICKYLCCWSDCFVQWSVHVRTTACSESSLLSSCAFCFPEPPLACLGAMAAAVVPGSQRSTEGGNGAAREVGTKGCCGFSVSRMHSRAGCLLSWV